MISTSTASNPQTHAPPLFITVADDSGRSNSAIINQHYFPGSLPLGERVFEVKAPNGIKAEGELTIAADDTPAMRYEKVVRLVQAEATDGSSDDREMLAGAGLRVDWSRPDLDMTAELALWRSGGYLSSDKWKLVGTSSDRGANGFVKLVADEIDNVQIWTASGPSIIARWSPSSTLFLSTAMGRSGLLPVPQIIGSSVRASAYWGFLRHGFVEAAAELGRMIASESEELGSGPELIVAAQWAARFSRDGTGIEISDRLAQSARNDVDAAVMQWVLACELGQFDARKRAALFRRSLIACRKQTPMYTETLRLMVHKLSIGLALCTQETPDPDLERDVDWARTLGHCAYWDTERTTYRGLQPGNPAPNATGADVPEAVKKKSGS